MNTDDHIKTFEPSSKEYRRLELVSETMNLFSSLETKVETVFFDLGQDWKWTTIATVPEKGRESRGFQILSPRQHRDVVEGSLEELHAVALELVRKYPRR